MIPQTIAAQRSIQQMSDNIQYLPEFSVRHYQNADMDGLRAIYGDDEFARPRLMQKFPRMREYLADEVLYYFTRYEPESLFVAEAQGGIIGALLGAINTPHQAQIYRRCTRPYLALRFLAGAYGWPGWVLPVIRTEFAGRNLKTPKVNHKLYPAHLHIGVLPAWRRHGVGTALMDSYAGYLRQKNVAGYHLYCSSFHPLGLAFYRKLGLDDLGHFNWRFHDGYEWMTVIEYIFGRRLN